MTEAHYSSPATHALYVQLGESKTETASLDICARLILAIFDDFYAELCNYPWQAKKAFEQMDPNALVKISHERLGLYSSYIRIHGPKIQSQFPALSENEPLWDVLDKQFADLIDARYEADIAFAFAHSIRRNICHVVWRPVAYSFQKSGKDRGLSSARAQQRFVLNGKIDRKIFLSALQLPRFKAPYRDLHADVTSVVTRLEALTADELDIANAVAIEFIEAGFFRDHMAVLVGRFEFTNGSYQPVALVMHNSPNGIYVDALLHQTSDLHNLFSSTLANFHVTNELYYQVCVFLASTMPLRPLGLNYSTIGFNHVGKVAILDDIHKQSKIANQHFTSSPGADGTVDIGFTFEKCSYHLKVIRDKPTASYKWGDFAGVNAVLDKYRTVHEINRTGSMVDNVLYFNLQLSRDLFDEDLLENLVQFAPGSVQLETDYVFFRCLIVQLKIIPLPVYFEQANDDQIDAVMNNLGHCIKNNIAANIFNKDLDARNYGVGRYGKVFLFDYDALEKLTDIEISTNVGLEDGEEDVPDWFFSDKFVFLPEELESGLQINSRYARRCFRETHSDLLTKEYWLDAQRRLQRSEVIELAMYPSSRKL